MPKFDLALTIDFEDGVDIDATTLAALVNSAVLNAIPDLGERAPTVDVREGAPRVLVTVSGGVAELVAVDGVARVNVIDYDGLEEDFPTEEAVQRAIEFDRHEGSAQDMDAEIEKTRADISAHLPKGPTA